MKKILFLIGIVLVLIGGCNMSVKDKEQNLTVPAEITKEDIGTPTEGVEPITDEFSGSKWTGQVGQEKYQIRFEPENNICKTYCWGHINWGYQKWYYNMSCFRKNEDGKILFDFKPYIDYAESYSMEKCWIASYAMCKENYEDNKNIFETATDPVIKNNAKKEMEAWAGYMKKVETFESFKKMEKVDEWFQFYKKYHTQRAAGLKAVNPVIGTLSADKKTLTIKKMFIKVKEDGTAEYAENVVFTRE